VRRYAGDDVRQVIVVGEPVAGPPAPRRGGVLRRRVEPGPAAAVAPVTRVTVIDAEPLGDPDGWLREPGYEVACEALARLVALHRVAAADPAAGDVDLSRALVTRAGYGTGEQVAEGAWEAARVLVESRAVRRRRADTRHVERLAALLAARDAPLACEELALRARADADRGRDREAALQLEAALLAALAELQGWRRTGDVGRRLMELEGYRDGVAEAAAAAREGRLEPEQVEVVGAALARLEAALRARAANV
jgi:hypothetical protein